MNENEVQSKMVEYQQAQELKKALDDTKKAMVEAVYTPEIRKLVADIETELAPKYEEVNKNIDSLKSEITAGVLELQRTVKVPGLHAVYTDGQTTWETDKLEGLALAFPPLLELRKTGDPYVSIKKGR